MAWGDKGEEYRPDKCEHAPDDGCMWCCQQCNYDTHHCPGCGAISNHHESYCNPCVDHRTGEQIHPVMECFMGFCPNPATKKRTSFGSDTQNWYCDQHADLADAYLGDDDGADAQPGADVVRPAPEGDDTADAAGARSGAGSDMSAGHEDQEDSEVEH